ncbi:MAG TPA: sugar MFS transporter [Bacteroidales bacterium]
MAFTNANLTTSKKEYIFSITIIGAFFFIFGFVTWLNGTLIPFLKISCELTTTEALLVAFAFYISYFVMAMPASWVLHKTGFKNGMALGLFIMALGSLVFIPAALTRTFVLFLGGLFVQGTGLALLQTASNPYVTIIGPRESAAKRISIMGICNKFAGAISPLIMGFIVLQNADQIVKSLETLTGTNRTNLLDSLAQRVILPYIIMAAALFGLSLLLRFVHLPEIDTDTSEELYTSDGTKKTMLIQFPQLVLGFIALFVYVGVEVLAGDTIILYGQSQGIALYTARTFTTFTLISMIVGYILGIITIPRIISQSKALLFSAILGMLLTIAVILTSGYTSVACIALLGLANAIMWPAIWPLAIADLGKFTKSGSALLIMGIAGGATIPLLYGRVSDTLHNPQQAYWIMFPIYLFIFYYAGWGHKLRK